MERYDEFEIVLFLKQFRGLLGEGIAAADAIETLAGYDARAERTAFLRGAVMQMRSGKTLAEALFAKGHPFPGSMERCFSLLPEGAYDLEAVVRDVEKMYQDRTSLPNTRVNKKYLWLIAGVAYGITMFCFLFVVPLLGQMFTGSGQALPLPTRFVLFLSRSFLTPVIFCFVYFSYPWLLRRKADDFYEPLLFALIRGRLQASATLHDAVTWAAACIDDVLWQRRLKDMAGALANGSSFGEALRSAKVDPAIASALEFGERKEGIISALNEAFIYSRSRQETRSQVGGLVGAGGYMIMIGCILGLTVVAMYMPIFQMGSVVR